MCYAHICKIRPLFGPIRNNYVQLFHPNDTVLFIHIMHIRNTIMLVLTLVSLASLSQLTGCALLAQHEQAASLKQALADDQACVAQGWQYPTPRYVTCRMQLEDQRQHRNWMNLQLMQQTQTQRAGAPPPYASREQYRHLDRDTYQCRYTSENGKDYILCGEVTDN